MTQRDSDTVLHQDLHEDIIEAAIEADEVADASEDIDDLVAITGGETPSEAEHNLVVGTVNDILAALRTAGILTVEAE